MTALRRKPHWMINHALARQQGTSLSLLPIAEIVTRPVMTQGHRHLTWLLEVTSSKLARPRTYSGGHVVEVEDLYKVLKVLLRYLRLLLHRLQSIRLDNDLRIKSTALCADDM